MTDEVFSASWYRVAALQPRLRSHTEVHRHRYRGELWYLLHDRQSGRQHRVTPAAHHLIALGVIPGSRVTIFLERTTDLVVAILGVLKTGAAYVPLDPTYPADRLAFIQEDAEAHVMITQTTLVGRLSAITSDAPLSFCA